MYVSPLQLLLAIGLQLLKYWHLTLTQHVIGSFFRSPLLPAPTGDCKKTHLARCCPLNATPQFNIYRPHTGELNNTAMGPQHRPANPQVHLHRRASRRCRRPATRAAPPTACPRCWCRVQSATTTTTTRRRRHQVRSILRPAFRRRARRGRGRRRRCIDVDVETELKPKREYEYEYATPTLKRRLPQLPRVLHPRPTGARRAHVRRFLAGRAHDGEH